MQIFLQGLDMPFGCVGKGKYLFSNILQKRMLLILWVSDFNVTDAASHTNTRNELHTNHFLFVQHKMKRSYFWGTYTTYWMAEAVFVPPFNWPILLMFFSKVLLSKSENEKWILFTLENWTMANCKDRGKISTYEYILGFCEMKINAI